MCPQTNGPNTAGTSPKQVDGTSPEQSLVHKIHLDVGFPKGCQGGRLPGPRDGKSETHTHAGMRLRRPMLTMETRNYDHSPPAHGSPPPVTMNVKGKDQSIMRHNGGGSQCSAAMMPMASRHLWFFGWVCSPGFQLKRGQQLLPVLLERPLGTDGESKRHPGSRRVPRPPEGIHIGKGAPC